MIRSLYWTARSTACCAASNPPQNVPSLDESDASMSNELQGGRPPSSSLRGPPPSNDGLTCDGGAQLNQAITINGRQVGNCETINPCLCGIDPISFAIWCPNQCRPACGGQCAQNRDCPNGFAVDKEGNKIELGDVRQNHPYWYSNLGPSCL